MVADTKMHHLQALLPARKKNMATASVLKTFILIRVLLGRTRAKQCRFVRVFLVALLIALLNVERSYLAIFVQFVFPISKSLPAGLLSCVTSSVRSGLKCSNQVYGGFHTWTYSIPEK